MLITKTEFNNMKSRDFIPLMCMFGRYDYFGKVGENMHKNNCSEVQRIAVSQGWL